MIGKILHQLLYTILRELVTPPLDGEAEQRGDILFLACLPDKMLQAGSL